VDRLIALVALRLKLELRGLLGRRERLLGLLLLLPGLLLGAGIASVGIFFGVTALERTAPELLLPALSAAVTLVGLLWAISPMLTGLALAETHDLGRLLSFPVSFLTLLASSLIANLVEPAALLKVPLVVALAVALSAAVGPSPLVLLGVGATFVFMLAFSQTIGLVIHALARNRRLHDRLLFVGIAFGFVASLLPFLFLAGGRGFRAAVKNLVATDVFVASPWAWGLRAAVHGGRGEGPAFALFFAASLAAVFGIVVLNARVARRIYEGELDVGPSARAASASAPFRVPGIVGTLYEKDLRLYWRDPRLKAMLVTSVLSPLVLLLLWRSTGGLVSPSFLVFLSTMSGLGTLSGSAFGLERRGLLLLFTFPVDRFQLLLGKNLATMTLRLPGLLALAAVAAFAAPGGLLVPIAATAIVAMLLGAAMDNYLSILYPIPVPEPGKNPYGPVSGGRGLLAAAVTALMLVAVLVLASPFVFLAWLPVLFREPAYVVVFLPLSLLGAAAVYALLLAGAARLLERREPELLARVLAEE
jgi:ABC-2 type transport system permease protein